jgi:iron only hydrogenase large subunit-like protein
MKKGVSTFKTDNDYLEPLVTITEEKCTNCYTCVRICPVKAIRAITDSTHPKIDENMCIGCGACIESCAPNAIHYRSSIEEAKEILGSEGLKVAIVSSSISAEFDDITDYRKFVQMIKSLGIDYVYEVSFGADLIAHKYLNLFNNFKGRYYISSTDPVVVNYVEKFHPTLVNNLVPFVSPMIAMTQVAHKIHDGKVKKIYIGPDIARKNEALRYDGDAKLDCVLTFPELRQLFTEFNIDEGRVEYAEFSPPRGYKGSLFPISNGLIQAADINENLLTTNVICVQGKKAMIESIVEFENNVKVIHRHLHVTYGNNLAGPGISNKGNKLFKEHLVIKYANKRITNFFRAEWYNDMDKYGDIDFSCKFKSDNQQLPDPPAEKINEALKILGKKPGDAVNCNQCGYASCREFAVDMAKGIVIPEMCSTYAIRNTKQVNSTLHELNENLARTRQSLRETEEKFKSEHDTAVKASELSNAMLNKLRAGIVIVDFKDKIVIANEAFCRILGEEAEEISEVIPGLIGADLKKLLPTEFYSLFRYVFTNSEAIDGRDVSYGKGILNISIFPIIENQIAGGIFRDMKAPEVQRAEVVKRVSDVIDKNLEMVQKIGFLLGEGASDIERMLNSVIQFYESDNKKN